MASRCTLMGISVAEICGIEMTSADSYSLLFSPPCRASTEAICLGDTNTHRYGVDTLPSSCCFFSSNVPVCTVVVFLDTENNVWVVKKLCDFPLHAWPKITLNMHGITLKATWK